MEQAGNVIRMHSKFFTFALIASESKNSQSHFKTGNKTVFDTVPEAPVAAGTNAGFGVPQMALTKRLGGLGIAPAVHLGEGGLGAYAGDLGKGLQQLGLDAWRGVFEVAHRPFRAGLYGPAFHRAASWLG